MINDIPFTEKTTLLLLSKIVWQTTDAPFQAQVTLTWILYRVSLGQEALYIVLQGSVVFLHTPLLGSSRHRIDDLTLNDTMIGGFGLGSNSHFNVTVWFSATSLEGITVKVIPAEINQSAGYFWWSFLFIFFHFEQMNIMVLMHFSSSYIWLILYIRRLHHLHVAGVKKEVECVLS